jgi:hypothetical protein
MAPGLPGMLRQHVITTKIGSFVPVFVERGKGLLKHMA